MAHTVTLRNRTKHPKVLNLPHALVPELATMGVAGSRDHDATPVRGAKDPRGKGAGQRTLRAHKKPLSGSITLRGKGHARGADYARGLPRAVLTCPDVASALARGDIELVEEAEAPVPPVLAPSLPALATDPADGANKTPVEKSADKPLKAKSAPVKE